MAEEQRTSNRLFGITLEAESVVISGEMFDAACRFEDQMAALMRENEQLRHDLEKAIANHSADLSATIEPKALRASIEGLAEAYERQSSISAAHGGHSAEAWQTVADDLRSLLEQEGAAVPPEAAPEELTERLLAEADLCRNDGATDIAKLLEDAAKQNEVHWRTRRTLLLQLQSTAQPPKANCPECYGVGHLATFIDGARVQDTPCPRGCSSVTRENESSRERVAPCVRELSERGTTEPPSAAINELLSYGGHRYVCDYVERGAKCSCGWQELSARVRAGLTKGDAP